MLPTTPTGNIEIPVRESNPGRQRTWRRGGRRIHPPLVDVEGIRGGPDPNQNLTLVLSKKVAKKKIGEDLLRV